jgi:hypothetical protein
MNGRPLTRRQFAGRAARWTLATFGAGSVASVSGCAPKARQQPAAAAEATSPGALLTAEAAPVVLPQRVVDVHIHANFADEYRASRIDELSGVDFSAEGLQAEMATLGVEQALSIGQEKVNGQLSHTADNPMGLAEAAARSPLLKHVHLVGGINPHRLDQENLVRIEQALEAGSLKGLKVYLGYYHLFPDAAPYRLVYALAGKYKVPVVLHTGDTYSQTAKVRFAHPLIIDDLAVDFPDTKFVIAHLGNPWTLDAAEVVYKNANVFADLSGFLIGNAAYFANPENEVGISHAVGRIREAFEWVEDPGKFLYGSDWPLAPMASYLAFVARAIEPEHHERVFYRNAKELFGLA